MKNQADIPLSGHAIEARICAENVARGFLPAAGTLRRMRLPSGVKGAGSGGGGEVTTRVDTGVEEGDSVSVHYDPMVAKVGGHGYGGVRFLCCDLLLVGMLLSGVPWLRGGTKGGGLGKMRAMVLCKRAVVQLVARLTREVA